METEYTVMEVYEEISSRLEAIKNRHLTDDKSAALISELNWVRGMLELTPEINPPKV